LEVARENFFTPFFRPLKGGAPGKAGLLVGVNLAAIDYLYGCWDERIGQSVLMLQFSSGRIIQVSDREAIEELLEDLGLSGQPWELDLQRDLQ
jgi:hypothetical protein